MVWKSRRAESRCTLPSDAARPLAGRRRAFRPWAERLEDRTLLSATAVSTLSHAITLTYPDPAKAAEIGILAPANLGANGGRAQTILGNEVLHSLPSQPATSEVVVPRGEKIIRLGIQDDALKVRALEPDDNPRAGDLMLAPGTIHVDTQTIPVGMQLTNFQVFLLRDGKILVIGQSSNAGYAVLRLHGDGRLDTTFGDQGVIRRPGGDPSELFGITSEGNSIIDREPVPASAQQPPKTDTAPQVPWGPIQEHLPPRAIVRPAPARTSPILGSVSIQDSASNTTSSPAINPVIWSLLSQHGAQVFDAFAQMMPWYAFVFGVAFSQIGLDHSLAVMDGNSTSPSSSGGGTETASVPHQVVELLRYSSDRLATLYEPLTAAPEQAALLPREDLPQQALIDAYFVELMRPLPRTRANREQRHNEAVAVLDEGVSSASKEPWKLPLGTRDWVRITSLWVLLQTIHGSLAPRGRAEDTRNGPLQLDNTAKVE